MIKRLILIASIACAIAAPAQALAQDTVAGRTDYETVAASQTDQSCGPVGGSGDVLERLIISVATAASAAVSIKDGDGSSIPILANSPGGGIGVYVVTIGARSTAGAWKVTTGAGSTVICVGRFK